MIRFLYSKIQRRTQSNGQSFSPGYQPLGQHRCFGIQELTAVACGTFVATLILILLGSRLLSTISVSGEFVPNIPFDSPRIFHEDERYTTSKKWLSNWYDLVPHDFGFIDVPEPSTYGLTGGYPLGNMTILDKEGYRVAKQPSQTSEAFCISAFHQLHCIISLKEYFENSMSGANVNAHSLDPEHINHCFDYLRQAVMCSADMSLEKVRVDEHGNPKLAVRGWGTEHKCRNWETVLAFVDSHGITTGKKGWKISASNSLEPV